MKIKLIRLLVCVLHLGAFTSTAQDTLSFMHYNLLNYGVSTSYCTPQNNDMLMKEAAYREIFAFMAPDILTVNEINTSWAYHKRFADSTLLLLHPGKYAYKSGTNVSGDIHANGVFYRKDKLILFRHESVTTAVRDFDAFTFYYRDPLLSLSGDTAFLTIISGHFKAGSTSADEADRLSMAQILTNFLDTFDMKGPVMLAGDFNMKGSSEAAFQELLSGPDPSKRLQDPLNAPGNWYNNATFAAIHTQSTQTNTLGCASGGGLDDRFDIILCSSSLLNSSGHFQMVANSYKPLGNDGQHFNQDINAGTNNAVPSAVADALHLASDHLPVTLRLRVDQQGAGFAEPKDGIIMQNIRIGHGVMNVDYLSPQTGTVRLFDAQGRTVASGSLESGNGSVELNISDLKPGIYFLVLVSSNHFITSRKLFIGG